MIDKKDLSDLRILHSILKSKNLLLYGNINSNDFPNLTTKNEFERLCDILVKYDIAKVIKNPVASGQIKYSPTNKTHDLDIDKIYTEEQNEKNRKELELEEIKLNIDSNKWFLKTKWLPHIISGLSLLWSILFSIISTSEVKNLEQRIEKLELIISNHSNDSKKCDSSLASFSPEKKD